MVVEIPKSTIGRVLGVAKAVIPARPVNPVHTYIYLEGIGDTLIARATSTEVDVEVSARVWGLEFSPLLVPPPFVQVVEAAPGDKVRLGVEEGRVEVSSRSWRATINTAAPEGFPAWPETEGAAVVSVPARDLLRALDAVRYAASRESWQRVFGGVLLEFTGEEGLRAVASDGYRMAIYDTGSPTPLTGRVLLPVRGVDEVLRALKGADGEATLSINKGFITLEAGDDEVWVRLVVRLVEAEYPDYRRVIPTEFPTVVTLDSAEVREAIKRVSTLVPSGERRIDIAIKAETGEVVFTAQGGYGQGVDAVRAAVAGQSVEQAYDYRHVLEALEGVEGRAVLRISGKFTPTLIEPAGGGGYKAIVVPLRV